MKKYFVYSFAFLLLNCSSNNDNVTKKTPDKSSTCSIKSKLSADSITNTRATLGWEADTAAISSFEVEYGASGFSQGKGTVKSTTETFLRLESLFANRKYDYYVRGLCKKTNKFEDWVGPFSFTTEATNIFCDTPSELEIAKDLDYKGEHIAPNYIGLTWKNKGTNHHKVSGVEVQYGAKGFVLGNGETFTKTQNSIETVVINNLSPNTVYDFYVRTICKGSGYSNWTPVFSAKTGPEESNLNCLKPKNLRLHDTKNRTITIEGQIQTFVEYNFRWTAINKEKNWKIIAVYSGDTTDKIQVERTVSALGATLIGLRVGQEYDIYVRGICGDNNVSDWHGPLKVTGISSL